MLASPSQPVRKEVKEEEEEEEREGEGEDRRDDCSPREHKQVWLRFPRK